MNYHYYTCVAMLIFEMQLSNSLARDGGGVGIGVDLTRLLLTAMPIGCDEWTEYGFAWYISIVDGDDIGFWLAAIWILLSNCCCCCCCW